MVSIIMSVYNPTNYEHFLDSLNSIFSQSYKNYEIILCDDGSSKDIESYLKVNLSNEQFNKIKFIQNRKNKGLAYSLNRCILVAKGSYIARMDADDLMHKDRIKIQVKYLKEHENVSFVSSYAWVFDGEKSLGNRETPLCPDKKDLIKNAPYIHAATVFRKESLFQVGMYTVSKRTLRTEDYDLWFKMYSENLIGRNIPIPLYGIREDSEAYRRKKYKFRLHEAKTRFVGYRWIKAPYWAYFYLFKPLIIGLIPSFIVIELKRMRDKK